MLMSRLSSLAHKLLMLMSMLMLASLVRTGLKFSISTSASTSTPTLAQVPLPLNSTFVQISLMFADSLLYYYYFISFFCFIILADSVLPQNRRKFAILILWVPASAISIPRNTSITDVNMAAVTSNTSQIKIPPCTVFHRSCTTPKTRQIPRIWREH